MTASGDTSVEAGNDARRVHQCSDPAHAHAPAPAPALGAGLGMVVGIAKHASAVGEVVVAAGNRPGREIHGAPPVLPTHATAPPSEPSVPEGIADNIRSMRSEKREQQARSKC